MGDPKKQRKKYETLKNPWRKEQIEVETALLGEYGLRNKRELWRYRTMLSQTRGIARSLLGKSEEERAIINMLQYEVISKKLPIQLTIAGEPSSGYAVMTKDIIVEPQSIVVIGPKKILEGVTAVRTIPIDISEFTKTVSKEIPLAPIARGITLKDDLVKINIPIEKIEMEDSQPSGTQ